MNPMAILGVIGKQHEENTSIVAYARALEQRLKENNIPVPTPEEIQAMQQGGQN